MGDARHLLLYGGTFDPVHVGHVRTSGVARELVGADVVVMVPAWVSPHKVGVMGGASGEQRLEMLRIAVAGDSFFEVDGREVERGERGGGVSYTIETVEGILGERPGCRVTLLMGADQVGKLHTWRRVEELLGMVGVGILRRGEGAIDFANVREHLGEEVARRLEGSVLETPVVEVSATEIRRRVRAGLSIGGMVPARVEGFILERGLYLGGTGSIGSTGSIS